MKNLLKILILFILVVMQSCNSDFDSRLEIKENACAEGTNSTRSNSDEDLVFDNPFKCLGVLHNQAMDSIKVKQISVEKLATYTDDFTLRHADMVFGLKEELSKYSVNKRKDIVGISVKTVSEKKADNGMEICDSVISVTPIKWQPYLRHMETLIEKAVLNGNQCSFDVCKEFSLIENKILSDSDLTIEERSQLLAISAITNASVEYNVTRQVTTVKKDWAETVVKADFEGAVCGALDYVLFGGSVTGLMFGPGGIVLTCGAYIVKGAILGSAVGLIW